MIRFGAQIERFRPTDPNFPSEAHISLQYFRRRSVSVCIILLDGVCICSSGIIIIAIIVMTITSVLKEASAVVRSK